jgi:hypothetical protein
MYPVAPGYRPERDITGRLPRRAHPTSLVTPPKPHQKRSGAVTEGMVVTTCPRYGRVG